MMKLFFVTALLIVVAAHAEKKPDCKDFSKGSFTGGVATEAQCGEACRTAEGLTKPGNVKKLPSWKTCEGELSTGNSTSRVTGGKCQCRVKQNEYRGVCEDQVCSGSAIAPSMLLAALVTIGALSQMWQ
eukprot:g1373.t1